MRKEETNLPLLGHYRTGKCKTTSQNSTISCYFTILFFSSSSLQFFVFCFLQQNKKRKEKIQKNIFFFFFWNHRHRYTQSTCYCVSLLPVFDHIHRCYIERAVVIAVIVVVIFAAVLYTFNVFFLLLLLYINIFMFHQRSREI